MAKGPARRMLSEVRAGRVAQGEAKSGSAQAHVPVAHPAPRPRSLMNRRTLLLGGFWGGLIVSLVGVVGMPLDFLWPRKLKGFGSPVRVSANDVPEPGADPFHVAEGRFYVMNLGRGQEGSPGGVIALYHKCPHLGCTVPWRREFEFAGRKGWYRCPCHGSTYTKAGILVFGPSPRSMDTMEVELESGGDIVVDSGQITLGSTGNPRRAIPYRTESVSKRTEDNRA